MRYTLDLNDVKHGLCRVLDNGDKTEAFAKPGTTFGDKCVIHGGEFQGGEFHGGRFRGGEFHGGEFHGGWFRGGEFHGGRFLDGEFRGGEFRGGQFHGGWFHGGWFLDGWLPLQIQGSRHFVNIPDGAHIQIGCLRHTPSHWLSEFESIGREEGYTPEQIVEYGRYIRLAAEMIAEGGQA